MAVSFQNAVGVSKDIDINVINDVRRLCFGGALLFALFLEKLFSLVKSSFFVKVDFLKL